VYDQLYTGETLTEYKVETLQENVDPILENYMAE
jgi:hypothetical protein